jgi:hypothetical protein
MTQEWKDRLNGLLSRKFLAFVIATVLVFMGKIEGWMWAGIAGAYLGINLLQKQIDAGKEVSLGNGTEH